ncbi:hypothetical protein JY651_07160 [Pyxidicoccus parkwayensis]|jgi:hypothetical protein|uniref:Uncharacterized protein n=1 Tax=Pyxidicoccus parkwayensis TaxID=2813578 RepID=A0ABX7P0L8_9BACT|nr:hypothetical protein [Pyxidicoccus parkwaysis]QSQ24717.1 hypothetical protein JY651_07160 [Pyxidicoccus parkwaysis]
MAGEAQTGTRDEHYNLISALYHLLKGASNAEQYIADAEEAGDQELAQFFRDLQDGQKDLAERAKNLLGGRMLGGEKAGTGRKAKAGGGGKSVPTRPLKTQSNASVNSGGNAKDDIVDEESKESFPASDSPARY